MVGQTGSPVVPKMRLPMLNEKYQSFLSWNIYQIYPRSFFDANGDGIGDLAGVVAKLDYLKELGINAIWLGPCFKSPNYDNGYDVADYRQIMDEFGTMADMRRLIDEMHKRDMKLILDLVPNHTSYLHTWFQESRKSKDNPYSNYYYWFDTPPNNWPSMFGGTAYAFDEQRGQYYLHSYTPQQPDLNWNEPGVVKGMQAVADFWVDMGVDGFRIDVIDQISKDFEGDRNCFGPRLHEFIQALFGREKTAHLFTVGECWTGELEEICRHIHQDRQELSTLFQFGHLDYGRADKFTPAKGSLTQLWNCMRYWVKTMEDQDLLFSLFTDNHDNGWMLERLGSKKYPYESATCIAAMLYLMRGVCFMYQGQELGMFNPHYDTIEEFDDIESINMYRELCLTMSETEAMEKINFGSRDNTRRPFCWSGEENAGFSTGKPWTPVHSNYKNRNLEADLRSDKSVWQFYRNVLHLRKEHPALTTGSFVPLAPKDASYCAYTRTAGKEQITVVCNFEKAQSLEVPEACGKLLLSNYGLTEKTDEHYAAYEVAVFWRNIDG